MKGCEKLYKINKNNKAIIFIIVIIIVVAIYYLYTKSTEEDDILVQNILTINQSTNENEFTKDEKIFIYVSGAVNSPGVIEIDNNSRVKDAIEKAGGLKENADLTNINLAEKLEDEKKIYIPEEGENTSKEVVEEINNQESQKLKVNINTANSSELQKLPGIGPSLAESIVEYRKQNGRFASVEDIKKVSGIGKNKFNKIKEYIRIWKA